MLKKVLILLLIFALTASFKPLSPKKEGLVILVVNYSELLCSLCTKSLISKIETLSKKYSPVLLVKPDGFLENMSKEKRHRILKKQIKGFVKANKIEAAVVIDQDNLFANEALSSLQGIVFDFSTNTVKRLKIP